MLVFKQKSKLRGNAPKSNLKSHIFKDISAMECWIFSVIVLKKSSVKLPIFPTKELILDYIINYTSTSNDIKLKVSQSRIVCFYEYQRYQTFKIKLNKYQDYHVKHFPFTETTTRGIWHYEGCKLSRPGLARLTRGIRQP